MVSAVVVLRHRIPTCFLSEWLRLQRLFLLQRGSTHRHSLAEGLYNVGRFAQFCDIIAALAAPAMSQSELIKLA